MVINNGIMLLMYIISAHNENMPSIFFCDEGKFSTQFLEPMMCVLLMYFSMFIKMRTWSGYEKGTRERKLCREGASLKRG